MTRLVVFARAPVAGRVKTRLAATVGDAAATALYRAFLDDTVALAARADARVALAADDTGDDHLRQLAAHHRMALIAQGGGHLGERLARVFAAELADGPALIIGSDAPTLPRAHLDEALAALASHDVVLGPALDGGYWSIGLLRPAPALFTGISWSGPTVLAETLARVGGARVKLAPPWYDVDEADDLRRLTADLGQDPSAAPATRAALAALGLV